MRFLPLTDLSIAALNSSGAAPCLKATGSFIRSHYGHGLTTLTLFVSEDSLDQASFSSVKVHADLGGTFSLQLGTFPCHVRLDNITFTNKTYILNMTEIPPQGNGFVAWVKKICNFS